MNPIRSLFLKILLWFFMSLVLLFVILAGIFNLDFRLRPDSALITGLGGHGKALGRVEKDRVRVHRPPLNPPSIPMKDLSAVFPRGTDDRRRFHQ